MYLSIFLFLVFIDMSDFTYVNELRNYIFGIENYPIRNPLIGVYMSIIVGIILYYQSKFVNKIFKRG